MFSIWLIYLITQNFSFCSLTTYQFSHGVNWANFTKNTQLREILRVLDQFSKIEILVQLFGKKLTVYWYLAIPLITVSVCLALLPPPPKKNHWTFQAEQLTNCLYFWISYFNWLLTVLWVALLPPPPQKKSLNFSSRTINKLFILLDFVFQLIANRTLDSTTPPPPKKNHWTFQAEQLTNCLYFWISYFN